MTTIWQDEEIRLKMRDLNLEPEAWYRQQLGECGVPRYMHDGMIIYLLRRGHPGHFLTAVLSNDLHEACNRADPENGAALPAYVRFLVNYAPRLAWGTADNVAQWLDRER
jgi:hypothetical protein